MFVRLVVCSFDCSFDCLSVCSFVCLIDCLFVCLFVRLFVCLFLSLFLNFCFGSLLVLSLCSKGYILISVDFFVSFQFLSH